MLFSSNSISNVNYIPSDKNTLGSFEKYGKIPINIACSSVLVTKTKAYIIGGFSDYKCTSKIYVANILPDDNLSEFIETSSLPFPISHGQLVVIGSRVYIIGGRSDVATNTVFTAKINEDGAISKWIIDLNLPISLSNAQSLVLKDKLYMIGGFNGKKHSSSVFVTNIDKNNFLEEWIRCNSLPTAISNSICTIIDDKVYLIGGMVENDYSNTIYRANITDAGISNWSMCGRLSAPISHSSAIRTRDNIYTIGGYGQGTRSCIHRASIEKDCLSDWDKYAEMPKKIACSLSVVIGDTAYVFGGFNGMDYSSTIYRAKLT